jgi:hypothetical protein
MADSNITFPVEPTPVVMPAAAAAAPAASGPDQKLCIIFDAFQGNKNDSYIPKKCSIFNITTGTNISTYHIGPPFPWETLNSQTRNVNSYIGRYIIGMNWYSGELAYDKFLIILQRHSDNASQIFTKGATCAKYLTSILGRQVFNIENIINEVSEYDKQTYLSELPSMKCMFTDHKRRWRTAGFDTKEYTCCQDRAYYYGHVVMHYLKTSTNIHLYDETQIPIPPWP